MHALYVRQLPAVEQVPCVPPASPPAESGADRRWGTAGSGDLAGEIGRRSATRGHVGVMTQLDWLPTMHPTRGLISRPVIVLALYLPGIGWRERTFAGLRKDASHIADYASLWHFCCG